MNSVLKDDLILFAENNGGIREFIYYFCPCVIVGKYLEDGWCWKTTTNKKKYYAIYPDINPSKEKPDLVFRFDSEDSSEKFKKHGFCVICVKY
jgi:hypothetical protein